MDEHRAYYRVKWASLVAQLVKKSACNAGVSGSVPGNERFPGEGNGNLLQYSCLENSMDRGPGGLQSMTLERVPYHPQKTGILFPQNTIA